MTLDTVYDATVIALSNKALSQRKPGSLLDSRLACIEAFLSGQRMAFYNNKLAREYHDHVQRRRNDVIEAFLIRLADSGTWVKRSSLKHQDYAQLKDARWPSHDQHLIAAALEGKKATVFVTESAHTQCASEIKRIFHISIVSV